MDTLHIPLKLLQFPFHSTYLNSPPVVQPFCSQKMLAVFIFGSNKCFGLVDTDQCGLEENTTEVGRGEPRAQTTPPSRQTTPIPRIYLTDQYDYLK
jgi:hypothetical protein